MLGLLPDGSREVLTVVNHPTEGAIAWEMELEALKERGVEQIDLIVSDALSGIENAVCSAFPTALHQLCVVHFKRKVLNTVSTKDKAEVGEELKALFPVEHTDMTPLAAYENLGLMVKCTPERGQKCSLFHLMVKCTPIIVELPSVYRGCKPLICFQ